MAARSSDPRVTAVNGPSCCVAASDRLPLSSLLSVIRTAPIRAAMGVMASADAFDITTICGFASLRK